MSIPPPAKVSLSDSAVCVSPKGSARSATGSYSPRSKPTPYVEQKKEKRFNQSVTRSLEEKLKADPFSLTLAEYKIRCLAVFHHQVTALLETSCPKEERLDKAIRSVKYEDPIFSPIIHRLEFLQRLLRHELIENNKRSKWTDTLEETLQTAVAANQYGDAERKDALSLALTLREISDEATKKVIQQAFYEKSDDYQGMINELQSWCTVRKEGLADPTQEIKTVAAMQRALSESRLYWTDNGKIHEISTHEIATSVKRLDDVVVNGEILNFSGKSSNRHLKESFAKLLSAFNQNGYAIAEIEDKAKILTAFSEFTSIHEELQKETLDWENVRKMTDLSEESPSWRSLKNHLSQIVQSDDKIEEPLLATVICPVINLLRLMTENAWAHGYMLFREHASDLQNCPFKLVSNVKSGLSLQVTDHDKWKVVHTRPLEFRNKENNRLVATLTVEWDLSRSWKNNQQFQGELTVRNIHFEKDVPLSWKRQIAESIKMPPPEQVRRRSSKIGRTGSPRIIRKSIDRDKIQK